MWDTISCLEFTKKEGSFCILPFSALTAAHLDKGTGYDAGVGAGERPPGGPLVWPLLGPALSLRARSTYATDTDQEEMAQERSRAAIFFCSQSAINVTAEKPSVPHIVHELLAAQSFSLDYKLFTNRIISCCFCTQCLLTTMSYTLMFVEWSVWNNRPWNREQQWILSLNLPEDVKRCVKV